MINLSQKNVVKIAKETNFIKDNVEKVMRLADILEFVFTSKWKDKLALKGGTAINLFYRALPRLSVDIDLPCHNKCNGLFFRLTYAQFLKPVCQFHFLLFHFLLSGKFTWCSKLHSFSCSGMGKSQGICVQHQPVRLWQVLVAIDHITKHRMPDGMHMHTDLVGTAGDDMHIQ